MVKLEHGVKRRAYRSERRETQARETRRAVIKAATRLFVERGYGLTTIDAIAETADVGRATVFAAVGGKAALLKAAYDVALVGDDEPVALPDRPESRRVIAEPDAARMLAGYAAISATVSRRVGPMYDAVRAAPHADPAARKVWDKVRAERRIGARNVVRLVEDRAALREGLDPDAAADVVFVLNDPGLYQVLVRERGWRPEAFESWLSETLRLQLLGPTAQPVHTRRAHRRKENGRDAEPGSDPRARRPGLRDPDARRGPVVQVAACRDRDHLPRSESERIARPHPVTAGRTGGRRSTTNF
jgi:AcrR family transcriptional regulator